MDWIKSKTADELLELLQWIADRRRYRIACGISDPALTAEDDAAESAALAELGRRAARPAGVYGLFTVRPGEVGA